MITWNTPVSELTKTQKRLSRKLAGIAYEHELSFHLEVLAKKFDAWREKEITCWELNELIHQYHDSISRELYNLYNSKMHPIAILERAINRGFLEIKEIPDQLTSLINLQRFK